MAGAALLGRLTWRVATVTAAVDEARPNVLRQIRRDLAIFEPLDGDHRRLAGRGGDRPAASLLSDVFSDDLADLLEPVAVYDVHEDHRRGVVTLRVPLDRPIV